MNIYTTIVNANKFADLAKQELCRLSTGPAQISLEVVDNICDQLNESLKLMQEAKKDYIAVKEFHNVSAMSRAEKDAKIAALYKQNTYANAFNYAQKTIIAMNPGRTVSIDDLQPESMMHWMNIFTEKINAQIAELMKD